MDRTEQRIEHHARQLWEGAGKPSGGPNAYRDQARELAAIEENQHFALKPVEASGPYGEPVEENIAMENLGEFPTLTYQGDEQTFPDRDPGDVAEAGRVEPQAVPPRTRAARVAVIEGDDEDEDDEADEDEDAEDDEESEEEDEDDIEELDGELREPDADEEEDDDR